jgi:hypothetical protein
LRSSFLPKRYDDLIKLSGYDGLGGWLRLILVEDDRTPATMAILLLLHDALRLSASILVHDVVVVVLSPLEAQ